MQKNNNTYRRIQAEDNTKCTKKSDKRQKIKAIEEYQIYNKNATHAVLATQTVTKKLHKS